MNDHPEIRQALKLQVSAITRQKLNKTAAVERQLEQRIGIYRPLTRNVTDEARARDSARKRKHTEKRRAERAKEATRLREQGMTLEAVAERMGLHMNTVYRITTPGAQDKALEANRRFKRVLRERQGLVC